MKKEIPILKEDLMKTKMKLEAVKKAHSKKSNRYKQASLITEQKVAETIRIVGTDSNFLYNPHLISLLTLFQDDFDVDAEKELVRPVSEESFLQGCC